MGKEVEKVSGANEAKFATLTAKPPEPEDVITGLFLSDNAVFYINSQGLKTLVQFPTIECKKATAGIDPESFDDAKHEFYFLDQKASKLACEGPAYTNVEDPSVYSNCECLGVKDDDNRGSTCTAWTAGKSPWCFVNNACAHPDATPKYEDEPDRRLPKNTKILTTCVGTDLLSEI